MTFYLALVACCIAYLAFDHACSARHSLDELWKDFEELKACVEKTPTNE